MRLSFRKHRFVCSPPLPQDEMGAGYLRPNSGLGGSVAGIPNPACGDSGGWRHRTVGDGSRGGKADVAEPSA